ncbi:MAG: ASCH domain-containing protein [Acidimicrobiales bacterium]
MVTHEHRVLTVRQPWASLIILGIKPVENRTWPTRHRGRLYIHAGLELDRQAMELHEHRFDGEPPPLGAIIGWVDLVDCVRDSTSRWADRGAWHWILSDPVALRQPVPARGQMGLWTFGIID